jgi:hypothetical protein
VVDQDNPLRFENHDRYIANQPGFDNETAGKVKRAAAAALCVRDRPRYSLAAPSVPPALWASEIRAFLPRSPRR